MKAMETRRMSPRVTNLEPQWLSNKWLVHESETPNNGYFTGHMETIQWH